MQSRSVKFIFRIVSSFKITKRRSYTYNLIFQGEQLYYDNMNNVKLHRRTNCVFYVLPMLLALKYTQSILTCHFSLTSL